MQFYVIFSGPKILEIISSGPLSLEGGMICAPSLLRDLYLMILTSFHTDLRSLVSTSNLR